MTKTINNRSEDTALEIDIYEKYKTLEDLPVHTIVVKPEKWSDIKGVMHFVHGMSEHIGRYKHMIDFFKEKGYICVMSDMRGHGANVMALKEYGYFGEDGDKVLVDDLRAVNVFIKNNFPDFPIIMFAHSMGSLIVKNFLKKYDEDVDFVFMSGTPSDTVFKYFGIIVTEIHSLIFDDTAECSLVAKIMNANFSKNSNKDIPNSWICSDEEVIEKYNNDEKCGFSFKAGGYETLFKLMCGAYSKKDWSLNNKSLPIYLMAGKYDPVIINISSFKKQKELLNKVGYSNTGIHLFDNMYHEIHNEVNKETVFEYMLEKLKQYKLY